MDHLFGILGGLTFVCGAAVAVAKVVVPVCRTIGRVVSAVLEIHADWKGEPARDGVPARLGVMARLAEGDQRMDRIESAFAQLRDELRAELRDELAAQLAAYHDQGALVGAGSPPA